MWLWRGDSGEPLVIKYAEPADREAIEAVGREAAVLTALAPTGVVPQICMTLDRDGGLAGFALAFLEGEAPPLETPLISAFAASLARLHARTWHVRYPPFGLDVPVTIGGHTLWMGGDEVLSQMCQRLVNGPSEDIARLLMRALQLLGSFRAAMSERLVPDNFVLVHGDIAVDNLLFQREGCGFTCRFIDFGEAVIGPPQYDLARYAIGAELTADQEDLLLNLYECHMTHLTGSTLPEGFRDGFAMLKPFAVFDTAIAPYVIYAASGMPVDRETALSRVRGGLASIRSALRLADV